MYVLLKVGRIFSTQTANNTWSSPSIRGNPPDARDFHTVVLAGDDKVGCLSFKSSPLNLKQTLVLFGGAREIESKGIAVHFNDVHLFDTGKFALHTMRFITCYPETNAWLQPTISGPSPPVRWMHKAVVKDGTKVGCVVLISRL